MKNIDSRNYTINNNLISNNNVLYSIAKNNKKIHLIHLGTMGVYGYDFSKYLVPEGYYKAKLFIKKMLLIQIFYTQRRQEVFIILQKLKMNYFSNFIKICMN